MDHSLSALSPAPPPRHAGQNHVIQYTAGVAALVALYLTSFQNYLLFHSLAEIFSISIAFTIFIIAWNSRDHIADSYLFLLGIAYLFVGFLDLMHTLAYKGMGIFHDYDFYANQIWIATRFVESISLLAAFLVAPRRVRFPPYATLFVYLCATALILLSIFHWKNFPACFIEGAGLTPFKIASEYVICIILLACIALCYRQRHLFAPAIFLYLVWALAFTILSELAFTFYVSNYDISNMMGHYFKTISFFLVYKAIVETGIRSPYQLIFRELETKKAELEKQAIMDDLTGLFNRRAAYTLLDKLQSMARRERKPITVCFIDIDNLKPVNDTFGHNEGDKLIKGFADTLADSIRTGDYACRMGGDEFLVLFPNCTAAGALEIVGRLKNRLATQARHQRKYGPITFSYGMAQCDGTKGCRRLIEQADQAMYLQKNEKKQQNSQSEPENGPASAHAAPPSPFKSEDKR